MNEQLPLSLSVSGLRGRVDLEARQTIELVAALGYRNIQLDATKPSLRPRDLDGSARRGLVSVLRRLGLTLSGLDLWIPPDHFIEPAYQQRAIDAVRAAAELAADIRDNGNPTISLAFPREADEAIAEVAAISIRHGVAFADFGEMQGDIRAPLGQGFDPAAELAKGHDVTTEVSRRSENLLAARLSDWNGSRRVRPGRGRLDLLHYGVALSIAGYSRSVVVDLREVNDPEEAAGATLEAWGQPS